MIKEIQRALKLLKYSPDKNNDLMSLIFILGLYVLNLYIHKGIGNPEWMLSSRIIFAGLPLYFVQLYYKLDCIGICKSSPYRKKVQIYWPLYFSACISLIIYTLLLVALNGNALPDEWGIANRSMEIFEMGYTFFLWYMFYSVVYKFFAVGFIGLFLGYAIVPILEHNDVFCEYIGKSVFRGTVIGYIFVIFGFVMYIVISKRMFRKDLSKHAYSFMKKYKSA
ncbi:MAG: hypothetical protein J5802_07650 [Butyrivibrio sp.]|nr:hypothetical protein [Butyrivibrio sp.]